MKLGESILVTNLNKKSTMQVEVFKKHDDSKNIRVETYWRGGIFKIDLNHEYEMESLDEIIKGGEEYELETDDFESWQLIETWDSQSIDIDDNRFANQEELYEAGYECINEYYIIFNGIKQIRNEQKTIDIDLSNIKNTMSQIEAIKEFWEPIGMVESHSDCFDRNGFWAISITYGEPDSSIYLGKDIDEISKDLLSFSEYGVNYDPMGENSGNKKFQTIQKDDRLILCSHPESDPSEDCDIFIKIKN